MWGNCFTVALFYRLVYSCNMYYVSASEGLPHFVWYDKTFHTYRHFTYDSRKKPEWYRLLWYKGRVDNFPYEKLKITLIRLL